MTDLMCINTPTCTAVEHMICCPSTVRAEEFDLGAPAPISAAKVGTRVQISREYAISVGLVDPTPEEQAERDRRRAVLDAERAVVAARVPGELARLDAITDPVSRLVLDLHRRTPRYGSRWICEGCDASGYDADYPDWPCTTVDVVAEHHGIDLDDFWLFTRPDDGSLDAPTPEDQ